MEEEIVEIENFLCSWAFKLNVGLYYEKREVELESFNDNWALK